MKMNVNSRICGTLAVGCVLGMTDSQPCLAAVSDADFNALKSMVQQLQRERARDKQPIQQLHLQFGAIPNLTTNAFEKGDSVSPMLSATANNALPNFTMV